jgi:hypothetical protein
MHNSKGNDLLQGTLKCSHEPTTCAFPQLNDFLFIEEFFLILFSHLCLRKVHRLLVGNFV